MLEVLKIKMLTEKLHEASVAYYKYDAPIVLNKEL